jgi:hypothetical protein
MADIYEIAMRLAVDDEATKVVVELARMLGKLGDAAMDAADKLEQMGQRTAATFASLRGIGFLGAGGLLAMGAGTLGAIDLVATKYQSMAEQIAHMNEAGWQQVDVQKAIAAAQAQTRVMPLTSPEQNMSLINRLAAVTGSMDSALKLLGPTAQTAGVLGEKGTDTVVQLAQTLGLSTRAQQQQFLDLQKLMTQMYFASGRTMTPEMMLQSVRRMGAAAPGMSPEFYPYLMGLAQISGGAGGGFGGAMTNVGGGIAQGLQRLEKLPEELAKGKPPAWVYDIFGGPEGLTPHMLRQATTNPYEFMQRSLGPALLQKYGPDEQRIAAELGQMFGSQTAAAPWMRMLTEGRIWPRAPGEVAPLEAARQRAQHAMTAEEAERAMLSDDPEAIKKAIGNVFHDIIVQIGGPSKDIKVVLEETVLAGLIHLYDYLRTINPETVERFTKAIGNIALIMTGTGIAALLTTLAFTPIGGAVAIIAALSSLIYQLSQHPEVARAIKDIEEHGVHKEQIESLGGALWDALIDEAKKGDAAFKAEMAAAAQSTNKFIHDAFTEGTPLNTVISDWIDRNVGQPFRDWMNSHSISESLNVWFAREVEGPVSGWMHSTSVSETLAAWLHRNIVDPVVKATTGPTPEQQKQQEPPAGWNVQMAWRMDEWARTHITEPWNRWLADDSVSRGISGWWQRDVVGTFSNLQGVSNQIGQWWQRNVVGAFSNLDAQGVSNRIGQWWQTNVVAGFANLDAQQVWARVNTWTASLVAWELKMHNEAAAAIDNALNAIFSTIKNWALQLMGWKPTSPAQPLATTVAPAAGVVSGPGIPGLFGFTPRPGVPVAPTGAPPGSVPGLPAVPGLPGGPSGQAITPTPERHSAASPAEIEAATRNAIWNAPSKDARPIVVSLNIDGRRISEAISTQLAGMMGVPGQAPFHNAWGGWAPPDSQYATT